MNIPDKAQEAATFALFRQNARSSHARKGGTMPHDDMLKLMWETVRDDDVKDGWSEDAQAVLEAASRFIAAQALRDIAVAWEGEPAVEWTAGDILHVLNGRIKDLEG